MNLSRVRQASFQYALLLLILVEATASAQAQLTQFNSRTLWAASVTSVSTISFESIAPSGGFTAFDTPTGLTRSGVTFVGSTPNSPFPSYLRVVHPGFAPAYYDWGSGSVVHGPPNFVAPSGVGGPGSFLRATLPSGVTAVGTDIMSFVEYASSFQVTVTTTAGSTSFTVPSSGYPNRAFVGFTSSVPILSIQFVGLSGFPTLDNFSLGTIAGGTSGPTLSVSPSSLSFAAIPGTPSARRALQVSSSSGSVAWSATVRMLNGADWIAVFPLSGTASSTQPSNLGVEVNFGALGAANLYQALITVRDTVGGGSVTIPVAVVLSTQQSRIGVSDSSIHLTIAGGGAAPAPQTLRIGNRGGGTLNWSIAPNVLPSWLSASVTSGSAGGTTVSDVTLSVNRDVGVALASGVYQVLLPITAPGASNSPQLVIVTLQRVPGSTPPTPSVRPAGLYWVVRQGGAAPAPKGYTVSNRGGGTLTAGWNTTTASGGNWLGTASSGASVTSTSGPVTAQATVNPANLTRGIYRGTIRLTFSSGEPADVEATLIVTPPAAGAARLADSPSPQLDGCTPDALELIPDTIGNGAVVPISFPRVLVVTLIDSCGEFVDDAAVVGSAEGSAIPMQSLGSGTYSGTWVPQQQGTISVSFTALHPTLPPRTRSFQVSTAVAPEGIQLPVLFTDGVVEAAGFTPRRPLAPGGFVSLFGSRFTTQQAGATRIPLERELAGVRVKVGDLDAPLHFVSPGQINAQLPLEVQPGASVSVLVSANGLLTAPQTYLVAPAMPGIFIGSTGPAILDGQSRLVTAANPARIGDVLQIFATGLGATDPAVASGAAGPSFSTVTNPVSVTVGGVSAQVVYQGLAPGFVALYQVNIIVPGGVTPGDAVPIVLTQNGVASNPENPAVIPVQQP